jgi:exodeoxyribonuclease V beta subunit
MDLAGAEACQDLSADHPVRLRMEGWQELARQRRTARLFNAILEESGIVRRLLIAEAGDRALTNLHHLVELLRAEARAAHLGPEDLLARLDAWIRERQLPAAEEADIQRAEGEARAVRILTIHKAKGLEAPVVALFGGYGARKDDGPIHRFHDGDGVRSACLGAAPPAVKPILAREAGEEHQRLLYVAITRPKVQLILPLFEPGAGATTAFDGEGHPKGRHRLLNLRLRALQGAAPWTEWTADLPTEGGEAAAAAPAPLGPPPVPPPDPVPDGAWFTGLARRGRPLLLHSFTGLSKAFGEGGRSASREEEARADEVDAPRPARPEGGLARGPATGTALHELLEALPPGDTRGSAFAPWAARHRPLAEDRLRRNGLDPVHAPEALRLAWHALATPVALPGGPTLPLDAVTTRLPEMAFQMPFPGHPDGLEGSMDLIFEVGGRLFVLDWKTNTLRADDYGPEAVAAAVAEHYDLQVRIYTLAALAFAGIADEAAFEARFGGVLYLFLRGMPAGGVWTSRPAWAEVQAWRRELAAMPLEDFALARLERGMHG